MWKRVSILLLPAAWVLAGVAPLRAEETAAPAAAEEKGAESLSDLNKKLTNPVSSIWSLQFQQNNFRVDPGHGQNGRWSTNLIFQPVMPVAINDDWNLITRPVLPLFVSQAHPESGNPSDPDRSTAFGDITLLNLISPSPKLVGQWLLGVGPTWIFPTAPSEFTARGRTRSVPPRSSATSRTSGSWERWRRTGGRCRSASRPRRSRSSASFPSSCRSASNGSRSSRKSMARIGTSGSRSFRWSRSSSRAISQNRRACDLE